jgi:hypothetical protein
MKKHIPYVIVSLLVCLLIIVGCKPSTTNVIISEPIQKENIYWSDLQWYIKYDSGLNSTDTLYADNDYVLVDEDWFKENILNQFNDFLSKNGVYFGDANKNDCDNFSRAFSFFARVKSSQAKFLKYDIAVGELYYKNFDVGHAINFAIVLDKEGKKKIIFIEPQGPSIVNFSEEFKQSFVQYVGM